MEPTVESPTTRTSHFDNLAYGDVSEQPPEKHARGNGYSCKEEPSPPVCGKDIPDEPGQVYEYIGMSHCNPAYDISEQPPEKHARDNVYSQWEEEASPPVCGKDIPDEPGQVYEYIGMSHSNPTYDISEQPPEKHARDVVYSQLEEEASPLVCGKYSPDQPEQFYENIGCVTKMDLVDEYADDDEMYECVGPSRVLYSTNQSNA
ncbi:hypothetical protein OS493_026568 [Desmophyllum pertusum]|uniref:Uncharacterized protein n=1 Tax=Desmophyllum pertusum TaxID=174260 RepID=A0A9W9Y9T3_9CNID|nr:hypothetical protein OS493_026568 [Desmophyllum pertusum]